MKKLFGLSILLLSVVLFFISANTVKAENNIYKVLSPNGREKLDWSKTYLIIWSSDYNTKVDIMLYKNDAFFKLIAQNINPYPSAVYWTPSKTISKSEIGNNVFKIAITFKRVPKKNISSYKMFKEDSNVSWVFDKSDAPFSIVSLKKNSTTKNEKTIKEEKKIEIEKVNPENVKQNNVQVKTEKSPISEKIEKQPVITEKEPVINVIYPNGGETLDLLSIYKIKWNDNHNTKVNIELFKNDQFYKLIKNNVSNNLKTGYSWKPSKTISESEIADNIFKIAITFQKDGENFVFDKSDAPFSIVSLKKNSTTKNEKTIKEEKKIEIEKVNPENVNINTKFVVLEELPNSPKVSCILPILKQGQKNNAVYLLQIAFNKEGYYTEGLITGFFGSLTQKAVKNFQQSNNLPITGLIDKESFSKINSLINKHFSECN